MPSVFVSFDDLALLDLLAGSRIMRPERDPGSGGALIPPSAPALSARSRVTDGAEPPRSGKSSSSTSTGAGCQETRETGADHQRVEFDGLGPCCSPYPSSHLAFCPNPLAFCPGERSCHCTFPPGH